MKRTQKILLISLTFLAVLAMSGAASASNANYATTVAYYNASSLQTTAQQQAFAANPSSVTAITSADAGQNIVAVVNLKNTGAASHDVEVTVPIDQTYATINNGYIYGANTGFNSIANADGTVALSVATNYLQYGTYDATTGKWIIGNVGSTTDAAQPNFGVQPWGPKSSSNDYLLVFLTVKQALTNVQTLTTTATVTKSLDFPAPPYGGNNPNIGGTSTATSAITLNPISTVTVTKSFLTNENPKVDITNGYIKYGGELWLKLQVANAGPSAATNLTITDIIPTGLTLDLATRTIYQFDSATGITTNSPANASIALGTLTWTLNNLYQSQFDQLWVPLKVTASGTKFTNTATETQDTKNIQPGATQTGGKWAINSNTATLTVPKASNLTINKVFVNGSGVPQTSTYYGDNNLYALISVTNSGPDAANWVVAEDLLNPLLWTIDYSKIQTSYDGGITWATNDTNVYMLGNYLAWVVSPRKVTQTELAVLMLGIPLPNMPAPALLASGATALIKVPITAAITGTPAILGTNAAAIVYSDAKYSQNVGLPTQQLSLAEIGIQRAADLGVVKSVSDNTPDAGDVITFTLTATSAEDVNWVGNLVKAKVTDIINPQYFKFINITFKNVTNPTTPYVNSYTYDAATGKLVWTIGNLDDGAWIQALVTVQVLKSATTAVVDNTATIEGWWQSTLPVSNYAIHDLDPSNNSSTVSVNINGTTIPPLTVVSTTPSNNSDYYGLTKPVYITFSNTVNLTGAGSVLIKNLTSGSNISAPVVTVSGSQLKIQFAKSRLKNNVYQITIPAGLVVDQYGQKNAAFTLTFTAKQ